MKISHGFVPHLKLVTLTSFLLLCLVIFGYMWVNSGGKMPVVANDKYEISASFPKVTNLVYNSDVTMAGVKVGTVSGAEVVGNRVNVRVALDSNYPLHEGATMQIREKTLVGETYIDLRDGAGKVLESGTRLSQSAAKPNVTLSEVLGSLDKPTRRAISGSLRELGVSTHDRRSDISYALRGLGEVGREGSTALDALANQSTELEELTRKTSTLLTALDTREGQLARLVGHADVLTRTTADHAEHIGATVRTLPRLLGTTRRAAGSLNSLSGSLRPVADNLAAAGPELSSALRELPDTSRDLRGLLPSLNGVLDRAPSTLHRVPVVAGDLQGTVRQLNYGLSDINPMLSYIRPYARDLAAWFTNIGQTFNRGDVNGKTMRLLPVFNEQTVTGNPLNTNIGPLDKSNAYPKPGQSANPGPFEGPYPRVEKDPVPK